MFATLFLTIISLVLKGIQFTITRLFGVSILPRSVAAMIDPKNVATVPQPKPADDDEDVIMTDIPTGVHGDNLQDAAEPTNKQIRARSTSRDGSVRDKRPSVGSVAGVYKQPLDTASRSSSFGRRSTVSGIPLKSSSGNSDSRRAVPSMSTPQRYDDRFTTQMDTRPKVSPLFRSRVRKPYSFDGRGFLTSRTGSAGPQSRTDIVSHEPSHEPVSTGGSSTLRRKRSTNDEGPLRGTTDFRRPVSGLAEPTLQRSMFSGSMSASHSPFAHHSSPEGGESQETSNFYEVLTRFVPGSFPDLPSDRTPDHATGPIEDGVVHESPITETAEVPTMSGALPATTSQQDLQATPPTPPGSYVGTAIDYAFAFAGAVKRRAVDLLTPPQPKTRHTLETANRDMRAFSEEERSKLKSDQYRRDRGLPTLEVQYPFPEIPFELPKFTRSEASLAQRSPTSFSKPPVGIPANETGKPQDRNEPTVVDAEQESEESTYHVETKERRRKRKQRRRSNRRPSMQREDLGQDAGDVSYGAETEMIADLASYIKPEKMENVQVEPAEKPTIVENDENIVQRITPVIDRPFNEGEEPKFVFGSPVSAVRLFKKPAPLPPGRTESVYAKEWREIEAAQKEDEKEGIPRIMLKQGQAVRPLPDEWARRVGYVMGQANAGRVATTLAGDSLTRRDLLTCYTRHTWLNDEVINAYLSLIIDYLKRTTGNLGRQDKPRFHAFNSFFFSNLRDKGYDSVRRWASRAKIGGKDLLNVDTVFVPVHNGYHWTLIVVKPVDRTIEHFDSLGSSSQRFMAIIKEWLKRELGSSYVDDEWMTIPSASPQQNNGFDCGVFLLSTAKAVALGVDPTSYNASNIGTLRHKIVAELMNGGFKGAFEPSVGGHVSL